MVMDRVGDKGVTPAKMKVCSTGKLVDKRAVAYVLLRGVGSVESGLNRNLSDAFQQVSFAASFEIGAGLRRSCSINDTSTTSFVSERKCMNLF
jgi:hypothetical protein